MNQQIQALRGIAILAVVIIHTYPANGLSGIVIRSITNFAVAMFIFLSGLLTPIEKVSNYEELTKHRILKVIIPYVLWSLLCTIAKGSYDTFIIDFLTANCNSIYYFIFVYIQLVLLTPILYRLLHSKFKDLGWFISIISVILFNYLPIIIMNKPLGFPFPGTICLPWLGYYYLGLSLTEHKNTGETDFGVIFSNRAWISCLLFVIILEIIEGLLWLNKNYDMATTQLKLSSMAFAFVFIMICYKYYIYRNNIFGNISLNNFLISLGNYSFFIYLFHILVREALERTQLVSINIFPINSLIVLTVSYFVGYFTKRIMKKYSWIVGL